VFKIFINQIALVAGQRLEGVLCVPSMHLIQKGFKSSVYRMNIEKQKKLLTVQRTSRGRAWEAKLQSP